MVLAATLLVFFHVARAIASIQPAPGIAPDRVASWTAMATSAFFALFTLTIVVYLYAFGTFYDRVRPKVPGQEVG